MSSRACAPWPSSASSPERPQAGPREVALQVGADPQYPLGATLTVPDGPGPFPAVVLVHGSGPLDRDETVGATRMFADLAAGLAARGIAVLRYDKRTFTYADRLTNDLTLDDEVIDDAVDAVYTLAARRGDRRVADRRRRPQPRRHARARDREASRSRRRRRAARTTGAAAARHPARPAALPRRAGRRARRRRAGVDRRCAAARADRAGLRARDAR